MADLIDKYFATHLSLPMDEAVKLHQEYYTNYGLAIEGLVRHHQIDPLDYNAKVDDALPLEDIIKPNPALRKMLEDIDRSKVSLRLLTNAYATHAKRVVRLLGIDDLFESLTYCDYSQTPFVCKPQPEMYQKAMQEAGVERYEDCYFVGECRIIQPNSTAPRCRDPLITRGPSDDSYQNCAKAQELGWTVAHLVEEELPVPETPASKYQIRDILELRSVFPQFFKSSSA